MNEVSLVKDTRVCLCGVSNVVGIWFVLSPLLSDSFHSPLKRIHLQLVPSNFLHTLSQNVQPKANFVDRMHINNEL